MKTCELAWNKKKGIWACRRRTSTRVWTRRHNSSSRRTRSTSSRRSSRLWPPCLSPGSLTLTTLTRHSCSSTPLSPPLTALPSSFTFTTSRRSSMSSVSVLTKERFGFGFGFFVFTFLIFCYLFGWVIIWFSRSLAVFCSVCLVAENVIVCYFWFCVCYEFVWMMRKCRKCRRVGGKVCLILEGFIGFLWV